LGFVGRIGDKLYWTWHDVSKIKKIADGIVDSHINQMSSGTWRMLWSDKPFLVRVPGAGMDFYRAYFKRNASNSRLESVIRIHLQNLFSINWRYHSRIAHRDFDADCIMFSRNGSVNFYNLDNGIVKKKYSESCKKGFLELKDAGYWDIFRSPVQRIEKEFTYEKIITTNNVSLSDEDCVSYVIKKYTEYYKTTKPLEHHTIRELVNLFQTSIRALLPDFVSFFADIADSILNLNINFYIQHGDFTYANILFDNIGEIYVIDYELAGSQPFYQDILYFMTYKIGIGQMELDALNLFMDGSTQVGNEFDGILISQGIPTSKSVKLVLLLLTRIEYYNRLISEQYWSERDMAEVIGNREKMLIQRLIEHYAE